jgi:sialic acid synthase SpsE
MGRCLAVSKVFIIAEGATCWLFGPNPLANAYRMIEACAAAGASAFKTQWTSDPEAMAMRRGTDRDKYKRLGWEGQCLPKLKEKCEEVGIEFMCTVFLPQDVARIARYVNTFKVAAFEHDDKELISCMRFYPGKRLIASKNFEAKEWELRKWTDYHLQVDELYCVSKYPTPVEELGLAALLPHDDSICGLQWEYQGLSDHSTSTLSGALAVAAGSKVIEKHVRLHDTPKDDPDYGHSLVLDKEPCFYCDGPRWCKDCKSTQGPSFGEYVDNIREAERML